MSVRRRPVFLKFHGPDSVVTSMESNQSNAAVELLCGPTQPGDIEVLTQWKVVDNFNAGRQVGVWTRLNPGVSSYFAEVLLDNDGSEIVVQKKVGGVYITLDSANIDIDPGEQFWIRFRTSGTFIAVKVWTGSSSAEPDGWSLSGIDSSVTGSGRVGVRIGTPGQIGEVQIGEYHVSAA